MTTNKETQTSPTKVLVVDDETLVRTMLCDGLAAAGHTALPASSGEEALRLAKSECPACVVLDIMMPNLDGYETCAALKADGQTSLIPVLLVSATTDGKVAARAKQVGAAVVLRKPVRMDELQRAISRALGSSA